MKSEAIVLGEETFARGAEQDRLLQKGDHEERSLVLRARDLHLESQC